MVSPPQVDSAVRDARHRQVNIAGPVLPSPRRLPFSAPALMLAAMWKLEWRDDPGEGSPLYRILVLTATALVLGFAASFAAILFVECVAWFNNVLLISPRTRIQYEDVPWIVPTATVAVPTAGGLIVGILLRHCSRTKRPLGPPDVIQAVQFRVPLPDARSGTVSIAAATISLGFGASVGQYGPMVYLGAMFGNAVSRLRLRVSNLPAIAVACGVAAAISTAFNAPIAGLVFAHEVVLRHYSTQAFAPTTIAAAAGYVVANVVFERPALFLVDFTGVGHGHEFVLFGLLGALAAGVAIAFMSAVLGGARLATRFPGPATLRPAAAGIVLGLTALWLPEILGIGQELLRFATIEGAFDLAELPVLLIAKIALTALCVGFGFAGGVFSPALVIGALFGALFWGAVTAATQTENSGVAVYAICGMMAVASPVTGAPLTMILVVFELTRNYDITIAAMVAIVMSNLIAHRVFGRSLYDVQLADRGIDLFQGRDRARLAAAKVVEYGVDSFARADANEPVRDVLERLAGTLQREAFVVDCNGCLLGVIREVSSAGDTPALVGDAMEAPAVRFDETTTVWQAIGQMDTLADEAIPVVDSKSDVLIGVVTKSALVQAYQDISQQLRREENAPL